MSFVATLPAPLTADSRRFFAAWHSWRHGNLLPERRDLDTKSLGDLLPRCLFLEIRGRENIYIWFAGSKVREMLGTELSGRNYLDLTTPENRQRRAALLFAEAAQPCAAVIYYWLRDGGHGVMPVELVSAPMLADDAMQASLILACATPLMQAEQAIVAAPQSYAEGEGLRFIDIGAGTPPLTGSLLLPSQQVQ
ncbi:MAG TPA: PAS domain-containing protein [Ferrovibrio sp.]|jgi:hypothetical protein|uniref:PAS domain-containing protein n=1 Tax=Ferrovibrio sp. TaxID=1917215 RepID=UPI002ED4C650